jgi:hypothetical protein
MLIICKRNKMEQKYHDLANDLLKMLEKYYITTNVTDEHKTRFFNEFRHFLQWVDEQPITVTPEDFAKARDAILSGGYLKEK